MLAEKLVTTLGQIISGMVFEEVIGLPLANSKSFGCCILNEQGCFVYANDTFCTLYGYSKTELIGESLAILIQPESQERSMQLYSDYLDKDTLPPNQWKTLTKEGINKSVAASTYKIENKGDIYVSVILYSLPENNDSKYIDELKRKEHFAKMGTFEYQPSKKRTEWSRGIFDIFEREPELGVISMKELRTYASLEDLHAIDTAARACLEKNQPCDITVTLLSKDGSNKHIRIVAELKDNNKEEGIISGAIIDITDQLNTNLEFRNVSLQHEVAVQGGEVGVWEMDLKTFEASYNHVWHEMLGYSSDEIELNAEFFFSLLHPDDQHLPMQALEKYRSGKSDKFDIELRLLCKDGSYKWIQDRAKFVAWDEDGKPTKIAGTHMDITSQKLAQESLEIANNRLRSLIDASPIVIYSITEDGKVNDFWNPAAEKLYGWTREETIGKFLPQLGKKDLPEFNARIEEIKKGKRLIKEKFVRQNRHGKDIFIEITTGPIFDKNGNLSEILVITSDITELEQKQSQLEASLKEKEMLLQEIHHRVKNNLAVVSGLLHLQTFKSSNVENQKSLLIAQNRIRTIAMVHELLYQANDFSKIDLREYYLKLVGLIEENMQIEQGEIEHNFEINVNYININQAIPLGLLLNELLTNSIKYAFNKGRNKLSISIAQQGNDIAFEYKDNGPGFDPDHIDSPNSIGWELIKTLMEQLGAIYTLDTNGRFYLHMTFTHDLFSRGAHSNMKHNHA